MIKLDSYDKRILYELDVNARSSASEIAKKIKLAKETVNYRIKRVTKEGLVKKFYTVFNPSLVGCTSFYIYLKFHKLTSNIEKNIVEYFMDDRRCRKIRVLEGKYSISFLTIHRNITLLQNFIRSFLDKFGEYVIAKDIHILTKTHKLNQQFLLSGNTVKNSFSEVEDKRYSLDKIDIKIIEQLSANARIRLADLARAIDVDHKIIRYRIRKLEQKGIIVAYTTNLNLEQLKREFIQIDICLKNPSTVSSIIEFFDKTNNCLFAYELLGVYDVSIEVYFDSDDKLMETLDQFKKRFIEDYLYYDISHIYKEYMLDWYPDEAGP
ncbi:AsnC family transcriptional regulator [Candidatus Woesearchaeota archaeon]|nr:AsnC family transcriptional regulator [Candidatus Woesearchaeota archaeon]